jgi:hypothetical protein
MYSLDDLNVHMFSIYTSERSDVQCATEAGYVFQRECHTVPPKCCNIQSQSLNRALPLCYSTSALRHCTCLYFPPSEPAMHQCAANHPPAALPWLFLYLDTPRTELPVGNQEHSHVVISGTTLTWEAVGSTQCTLTVPMSAGSTQLCIASATNIIKHFDVPGWSCRHNSMHVRSCHACQITTAEGVRRRRWVL